MCPEARDEKRMPARIEHRTDSRERRSDLRIVGDIDHVAPERDSESSAQARAVNGGKRRRRKRDDSLHERVEGALDYRHGVFVPRMRIREVATRAERRPFA